jgi:hypothetical protein
MKTSSGTRKTEDHEFMAKLCSFDDEGSQQYAQCQLTNRKWPFGSPIASKHETGHIGTLKKIIGPLLNNILCRMLLIWSLYLI